MNQSKRPIRSYVLRQGRITKGQQHALTRLWPEYGIELAADYLDLDRLFGHRAPKILEIGFGMGDALIQLACENPDKDYLGVEVHSPGIGKTLIELEKHRLSNVKIFQADVKEVLSKCIPTTSLDAVYIFFPDPWPKKRHHKRRLIQNDFVALIQSKLKPAGILHMATDWEDYAQHMLAVMNKRPAFINSAGAGHFADRPTYRPLTKFEQRGQRLGHQVWDLVFIRL